MSTPLELIQNDVKQAMKAQEKERLSTLRLLLADIKNEMIRHGGEVDDEAFVGLVQRGIKQRRESAEKYRDGERLELAAKEDREAEILEAYLPEQVSEEEVRAAIAELAEREGLSGPQAIGRVMGEMMRRYKGRIEGKVINQLAREILG